MAQLLRILIWVVTNLPTIIALLRQIIDLVDGDTKVASACLKDTCSMVAKNKATQEGVFTSMANENRAMIRGAGKV